ncbi:hypothetical protein GJAV_G00070600 [Gymnothorax javanicus]|nr:hypothetical protein GJAV_G00070600 [Gymnothorax javanicus]
MATEELYEVEKIVGKRKNKKGKVEYLVHWRGFGFEDDTWEPETHLANCVEFIHEYKRRSGNHQRDGASPRSTRGSPSCERGATYNARKQICRLQPPALPNVTGPATISPSAPTAAKRQQPSLGTRDLDPQLPLPGQKYRRASNGGVIATGMAADLPVSSGRRSVDLTKTGIKILVPKSPMESRAEVEESASEAARTLETAEQGPDAESPEVAQLEKAQGTLLQPGDERARMGSRPRPLTILPPPQVPITPSAALTLSGKGTNTLMEVLAANGTTSLQSAVRSISGVSGKRRFEGRSTFDKRLRFSVRQTESAYRYRDIVVKKQEGFTHILLSTKTSENNSLNPDVMKEIQSALTTAASDDSKLVLLSAVGSVFCFGLDFVYFIRRLTDDRKKESVKMADSIRMFVNTFIQFKKPIIVAVNGPAVGLGAAILPLCDVVWANEKAWFQTPYTTFGQTPDACSSLTFPSVMGAVSASEMLLSGRKLTAQEACAKGLVSQVFWPGTFSQEVMVRIRELVSCNSVVLQESKALVCSASREALEQANERECEVLKTVWGSPQGVDSMLKYLQKKIDEF